ncbi:MAG: hypothetical protein EBZ62_02720 [Sphingobacteriia bacterium]|nr:hypothetical protein [Sphingobacteriia bacterium]
MDELHYLDIVDCNAGDHGKAFATNFNPEINMPQDISGILQTIRTKPLWNCTTRTCATKLISGKAPSTGSIP